MDPSRLNKAWRHSNTRKHFVVCKILLKSNFKGDKWKNFSEKSKKKKKDNQNCQQNVKKEVLTVYVLCFRDIY